MRSIRRLAALFACVMMMGLAAADLGAQPASNAVPRRAAALRLRPAEALRPPSGQVRPVSIALGTSTVQDLDPDNFHFYRPILRVGQDYTLRAGETARDVRAVFGDVTLEGHVERDIVVVLGGVHAASTAVVDGSLVVIGGSATIDRGASVGHDLVVIGGALTVPPDFSPGGQHVVIGSPALGNALNAVVPWITRGLLLGRLIVPDLGWVWLLAGIVFLVYLALNTLFDRPVRTCADAIVEKPLSTFLVGLLVLVLTVPALAVLAATVIGLAVVPFVLCAMLAGALIGKAGVARAVGRKIVEQSSPDSKLQSLRSFLLGFVVITLAYMIPVLGVVTWALTSVAAVGAAAAMLRATLRREHPPRERAVACTPAAARPGDWVANAPAPSPEPQPVESAPAAPAPGPAAVAEDLSLFPRAAFLDRVAAFALDCLLVGIAVLVFDLDRHGMFPLLLFAYHVAFWAWKGTTLGGIVVGLRVIRVPRTEMRFADALVRGLAGIISLVALGIGCFWMLQDPERQMWHDKIAGTVVVKVPRALVMA
jgi:uncharacterized RDD family membrane protein YckC